jgi:acyl-coenzyme A thioesterase PaaI-like protein
MIIVAAFLLLICHIGKFVDGFLLRVTSGGHVVGFESSARPTTLFKSSTVAVIDTGSSSSTTGDDEPEVFRNQPLSNPVPRKFEWWNSVCDTYLDELDEAGGERFVASHDEPDDTGKTNTNNWLHVTSSNPNRRVQYEVRYVDSTQTMGGVVRFGTDCEGPEGCAHGGSIASVADALTATCCFKAASERWGMTTRLDCNYRETIPMGTPVRVEATVVDLKKRKASLEWSIHSLTELDRNKNPVRHAFGSADFLLPRLPKE